jgi:hypothetical protein
MKNLAIFLLLIIPSLSFATEYSEKYGNYSILLNTREGSETQEEDELKIFKIKDNSVVFSHKDINIYLTAKGYEVENRGEIQIEDLTGNGIANLVVKSKDGGAHSGGATYILELGPKFKIVHKFDSDVNFKKVTGNKGINAVVNDRSFEEFYGPGVFCSVFKEISYYCEDDKCAPDFKSMAKPKLSNKEFNGLVKQVKKDIETAKHGCKIPVAEAAVALVYSGNADQAWKLIDLTWNDKKVSKEKYLKDFKCRLQAGRYFNIVNELNSNKLSIDKSCKSNKEEYM